MFFYNFIKSLNYLNLMRSPLFLMNISATALSLLKRDITQWGFKRGECEFSPFVARANFVRAERNQIEKILRASARGIL